METFNPHSRNERRSVQAWQILVGKAMNRQTITYDRLSELMYGERMPNIMNDVLGRIVNYCNDNGLPPLGEILVSKETGLPAYEGMDPASVCRYQEAVF